MEMTWVGMSVAVSRRWSKKCEPLSPLVSDRVAFSEQQEYDRMDGFSPNERRCCGGVGAKQEKGSGS